ncbi:uncharacterized protein [Magallana gigas]|uniref:uncharacterized protein n=1 Tax=Magallana gigas TaxID=29159 RepID=UPI00333F0EB2
MGLSVCLSLCLLSMGHMTSGWLWKPKPAPAPSQKTSGWLWKPTPTPAISSSYLHGCYVDQWSRTLNGGMTKSSSMTVDKCQDICKKSNKKYYGLENGEECFCGDYLTKSYKKSDSECKMACKGKRAQACGGTWRVLIYRNPYYRSILVKSGYQGCYQDQSSRTLNGKLTRSSSMTVYKCRDICSKENTYYYGVENANECFCGNSLTRSVRKSDNDCLTQCRGDRSQGCGGSWRVAVYRNYNYKKTVVQTSGLVGCYIDQRDRVLTGGKTKSSSMTLSKCRSRCEREKKKFYGLEVGTECFCGNYLKTSSKRSTSECLTPCTGNKAEGCGGNWRVVIYRNNNYRTNLVKTDFVGCYRDQWSRTLNGKKTTDRHMTYNKCKNICSHKEINSKYFGLENRDECFCGNSLTRRVIHDSEECTETCKGNSIQGCGGPWRVAVYKNPSHKQTAVSSQDLFGCFIDQKNRVLNGGKSKSSTMTLQKCKKRCVRENKKFYGLEVGTECFCGNYLTKHNQRPNKECMTPCKGDRSQACGGGWRVLIHNNTKYTSNVVNKDFKGCYVDQKSRTLKDYSTSSSKMTVEKCKDTCHKKNYKYYGVEATKECFCGNKLTKTVKKDTEECSSPCKGNRAQGCGGNWRLAVYENTKFPTKISTTDLRGCFVDQRSRTLNGGVTVSKSMTIEECQKICTKKNTKYFGLEVGKECFCGNYFTKTNKKDKSDCLMACKGNIKQGCGGHWRVLVYKNKNYKTNIVQQDFVGCYKDQRSRTLTEKKISSKKMTVDMCRKECLTLKMKYYGLEARDECFCGNKLQKKVVVADGECTDTCKGNKNQACGGSWKLAVYENPSFRHTAIVKKDYKGCYKDQYARTLNEKRKNYASMTVDYCRKICSDGKFKYYGVEAGHQCFCGNKLTKSDKKKDSECMNPCRGDREQACGGGWRIAIYQNPNFKPTAIVKKEFVGCYKDQRSRTLNEKDTKSSSMTVDKCRKTCTSLKYKYYGVEDQNECFCGDKLTKSKKMKESDCMRPCKGDREQACGGSWRIAVYKNPDFKPTAIVQKDYVGCYVDKLLARTLGTKKTSSRSMTVETCRKTCLKADTKYYGLEAGDECFCGNKLGKKKSDSECKTPCTGDKEQVCGGSWRLAVYKNTKFVPLTIVKSGYKGCFKDKRFGRALPDKVTKLGDGMTVETCRDICKKEKTKYYGLEAKKECWCGKKMPDSSAKTSDADCKSPCSGNNKQGCGGSWRIAVYKLPTKKSTAACKDKKGEVQCSTSNGQRSVCIVPQADLVLYVDPKVPTDECEPGETYGRHGDEIWVSGKCGGKFEICYREVAVEEVSEDCVKTADGSDYTGTWNKTKSGKTCQAWSSQTPHKHGFTSLPNNYCRNPDGEPHAWCYTTDTNTRWEFCDIPQCKTPAPGETDECLTEPKGQNYQGTKNVTKSGLKCQAWSVQTPHSHSFTKSLGNQENYCRNPDGEPKPWCYTTEKDTRWETCDIPECAACEVEQEKGPDCKVLYKISGGCYYQSHYRNECKYSVKLDKDSAGKLRADVNYGATKFSLKEGKGVNKCAYFKVIGDYLVIEDTLAHGC